MTSDRIIKLGSVRCFLMVCAAALILITGCGRHERAERTGHHGHHGSPGAAPPPITFGDKFYDVAQSGNAIWAVGYFGKIIRSMDAGKTFTTLNSGTTVPLLGISFINDKEGWVVGDAGTILHTKDGGTTWEKQVSTIATEKLLKVQFLNEKEGFAVGTYGVILHTSTGGATWERLASFKEDCILNDLIFLTPQEGWIAGEFETILHTKDGGRTWQKQREGQEGKLFGIAFKDPSHGIAVGTAGKILVSSDGKTWNEVKGLSQDTLLKVQFKDSQAIAIGLRGSIAASGDMGRSWSLLTIPQHYSWLSGISLGKERMFFVGDGGTIFMSQDGKAWTRLGFGPFGG